MHESTGKGEHGRMRGPALWRNSDYMLLWSGQIVSSTGTQVSQLAFPLLILALTNSPAQAGFAAALRALPYLLFSLPAGALLDRWDRKRVMIVCDVGRAISLGSIAIALVFGVLTTLQLYLVSLIEGTLFVFFNIAEIACLAKVVTKEQLAAANAQNQATDGVTTLLGPPLGGILYSLGRAFPFLVDALSYTFSVLSLFFIKTRFQDERSLPARKLWAEISEGLSWLWGQKLVRFMALLTGGSNFVFSGLVLAVIVIAQQQHASSFLIGLIFTIGGIGGIFGSLIATSIQRRFSFAQVILTTIWITALFTPLYSIAPNVAFLGIITAAIFFTSPIYNVVQMSYRIALIPDELQGRVNSVFRLVAFGGQPLGAALTGILIQGFGAEVAVLFGAAVMLLLAVAASLNPHVRRAR